MALLFTRFANQDTRPWATREKRILLVRRQMRGWGIFFFKCKNLRSHSWDTHKGTEGHYSLIISLCNLTLSFWWQAVTGVSYGTSRQETREFLQFCLSFIFNTWFSKFMKPKQREIKEKIEKSIKISEDFNVLLSVINITGKNRNDIKFWTKFFINLIYWRFREHKRNTYSTWVSGLVFICKGLSSSSVR